MTEANSKGAYQYQIKICGHLSGRRARSFEGLEVTQMPDGHTMITGKEVDQSALFGILIRIRDLGIPLHSVNRIDPGNDEDKQQQIGVKK